MQIALKTPFRFICGLVSILAHFSGGEPSTLSALNASLSNLPCPTVYIYFDVPSVDGGRRPDDISLTRAFGARLNHTGMRDSSPYNLAELMLYRLQHSKHCRLTRDPAKADLFIIPVLTKPKIASTWANHCSNSTLWGASLVNGAGDDGYSLSFLPHLTPETARRHLFFIGKGHYVASRGVSCAWIRGEPPAARLFRDMQRFAYSHTYAGYKFAKRSWVGGSGAPLVDGRVVSVPYPSWIHWGNGAFAEGAAPWQRFDDRPLRIHYIAGLHGHQAALRRRLVDECESLGADTCRALARFARFTEDLMAEKQRAVFCLEPEGDSPFRKSVYDSIVSGCIPGECKWGWGEAGGGIVGRLEDTSAGGVRAQGARRESRCCWSMEPPHALPPVQCSSRPTPTPCPSGTGAPSERRAASSCRPARSWPRRRGGGCSRCWTCLTAASAPCRLR